MDPLLEKAKADLAAVVQQIRDLAAKQKKLEAFISIYDEPAPQSTLVLGDAPPSSEDRIARALDLARRERDEALNQTAKARITNAVADILRDGEARHTRELLSILESRGIHIGSADKVIGLSSLLSKDDRFVANRTFGWSLKK
jgi:hypothetical protein